MQINGLNIDAEPEQIIEMLKGELERSGQYIFRRTKSLSENLQFTCPFHANGMEKKPSCGMSRETSFAGSKVYEAGTVHCFTCGYTANLAKFISDVLGRQDGGFYGNQWLKKNFVSTEEVVRAPIKLDLARGKKKATIRRTEVTPISENELDSYRWIHPYMFKRGLTDEVIEKFDVGYDESAKCITFPVRNTSGETVFIQRRGVQAKFHQYEENAPKTEYLYGEYELNNYFPDAQEVWITESIINALTLWKHNIPAVSLMGLGGGIQYELLAALKCRKLVIALDPDIAGDVAIDKLKSKLFNDKLIEVLEYPQFMWDEGLDLNDVDEDIDNLFKKKNY